MARQYRNIRQYRNEIYELHEQGLTHREVGKRLGLTYNQVRKYFEREHKKERQTEAGKIVNKIGRPCKKENELPPSIQRLAKLAQLRYTLASKERYIKRLEMENELMRDFLSLTERK